MLFFYHFATIRKKQNISNFISFSAYYFLYRYSRTAFIKSARAIKHKFGRFGASPYEWCSTI